MKKLYLDIRTCYGSFDNFDKRIGANPKSI